MLGNPVGGWLLAFDGRLGLHGWQWLFVFEGIPSVVLGLVALRLLTDRVEDAHWLSAEQRTGVGARMREEHEGSTLRHVSPLLALAHPVLWLAAGLYFLVMMTSYG